MKITPSADVYSKKFEICIIPKLKKWKLLMALPTIYSGTHGSVEGVEFYKSEKVEIFYNGDDYMNLDGNLVQGNQVVLEKSQKKLKIIK
jgi:diacylglycerol kinase family enzyme